MDILIKMPSFTSFLYVLTIIFYGIGLSIVKIKEIKCVIESGSEKTMLRENFQNTENNSHYDNIIDSMRVGMERNDAMTYNLPQMDSIVLISLFVFGYGIVHNGVEKENELEFKFENENENENFNCGEFVNGISNGINYNQLSPSRQSCTRHPATVFDCDGIDVEY